MGDSTDTAEESSHTKQKHYCLTTAYHQTQPPLDQLPQDLSSIPNIKQISEHTSKRNHQENKQNQLNKSPIQKAAPFLRGSLVQAVSSSDTHVKETSLLNDVFHDCSSLLTAKTHMSRSICKSSTLPLPQSVDNYFRLHAISILILEKNYVASLNIQADMNNNNTPEFASLVRHLGKLI